MIRIDSSFHWSKKSYNAPLIQHDLVPSREELRAMLDADDSLLVGGSVLYNDYLCLHIDIDGLRGGPILFQCRIPDPYLFETLFQLSPLTKSLANKYIDYEASTLDEYRIHFMARILGQYA